MKKQMLFGAAAAALVGAALVPALPAGADTFTVTTTTDGGAGSLRAAVDLANANPGADTIVLGSGLTYDLTICADDDTNAGGDLDSLDGPLTIQGNGSTIRQTCPGRRVLDHESREALSLEDVTITGGTEDGSGGGVSSDGPTTVLRSTIAGNTADGDGGGIFANDELRLTESTVSGNSSARDGGGINGDDDVFITNSTITGNVAEAAGGGIYTDDFDVEFVFVTMSGNQASVGANVELDGATFTSFGSVFVAPIGGTNCGSQSTDSLGYNYADDLSCELDDPTDTEDGADPLLGALADNGGPTLTMLPAATSPLVDAIPSSDPECTGTDQRGVTRPQLDGCDIGAVERAPEPPPTTTTTSTSTTSTSTTTSTTQPAATTTAAQPVTATPTFTG